MAVLLEAVLGLPDSPGGPGFRSISTLAPGNRDIACSGRVREILMVALRMG
jgi:hypothetical protein